MASGQIRLSLPETPSHPKLAGYGYGEVRRAAFEVNIRIGKTCQRDPILGFSWELTELSARGPRVAGTVGLSVQAAWRS